MPTENRTGGKIVPYGTSHITVKVWHISYEVLFFLRKPQVEEFKGVQISWGLVHE